MTRTVCYVGDQIQILALRAAQQTIDRLDDDLDQIDVFPLVESADVVGLGHLAAMENQVDGPCVVLDVEPVADVLAFAVDGQRPAVADVVDEQRNQLLRELIGTVVVRAVGHQRRHAVGVVIGPHEMVARGLRCRVGAMGVILRRFVEELRAVGQMVFRRRGGRCEGRFDALGMAQLQGSVDLVGGDVVEEFSLEPLGT